VSVRTTGNGFIMITTSVLALASTMLAMQTPTIEPRLLRQPDVHGNTVVFVYAGDLWASSVDDGAVARKIASNVGVRSSAAQSPVARPHISPDGKWVAFTGNFDGSSNIYVVSIDGGEPRRVTYSNVSEQVFDWTPDGKIAYLTTEGMPTLGRQAQLKIIDPNGGLPQETPIKEVGAGSFMGSSRKIVYTRANSYNFNWRRYRGGTQGKISMYDMDTHEYTELPAKRDQNFFPMPIGDSVYYVSDKANGSLNLFKNTKGRDSQVTKNEDSDIRWPASDGKTIVWERNGNLYHFNPDAKTEKKINVRIPSENLATRPTMKSLVPLISGFDISPSGARIVVDARGEVFSLPTKSGETRNLTNSSGSREKKVSWSPDGRWISYLSDKSGEYQLYAQPQQGGAEKQLTKNLPFVLEGYDWMPGGKKLLLMSPEPAAYVFDIETSKLTKIDSFPNGGMSYSVSEDGKYIAYTKGRGNGWRQIVAYEVETGKTTPITEGYYDDGELAFDLNGKYLYYTSSRDFNPSFGRNEFSLKVEDTDRMFAISLRADTPNPFLDKNDEEPDPDAKPGAPAAPAADDKGTRIDFDGIERRIMVLPMPAGNYSGLTGGNGNVFYQNGSTLFSYRMGAKAPTPMYEGFILGQFNPSRTKLLAYQFGGTLQVLDVAPGMNPASPGRVDTSNLEAVIDPRQEWAQIVKDAWRYERDQFYDANMAGTDWNAIGAKYVDMVKYANHRSDVNYILGMMIGELGTGHAYVQGQGDVGTPPFSRVAVGTLCADYEVKNGGVMFKKILRGFNDKESLQTPLGLPGVNVNEGDYLVAIDGKPVDSSTDPSKLLLGKVGKLVSLMVNSKPGMEGARKVRVRPIASDTTARYEEFIEGNRKMVEKLSGGRIGYMHIQNTAAEGSTDFVRGFYSQSDKDAMIVDERWNGGGYIQPWFVDTLARTNKAMIQPRYGSHQPESAFIDGPVAMLINGYAGSGGDFFPYMFRQAKRGLLIGKRTWGGLVGISGGYTLVDGGNLTAPSFSIYNPDTEEIIGENTGIDPDIDVDARPDLIAKGQDPQLEAAVKHLLEQLAKSPKKKPFTGTPKVNKNGKINP
jgi:tricorn protease